MEGHDVSHQEALPHREEGHDVCQSPGSPSS